MPKETIENAAKIDAKFKALPSSEPERRNAIANMIKEMVSQDTNPELFDPLLAAVFETYVPGEDLVDKKIDNFIAGIKDLNVLDAIAKKCIKAGVEVPELMVALVPTESKASGPSETSGETPAVQELKQDSRLSTRVLVESAAAAASGHNSSTNSVAARGRNPSSATGEAMSGNINPELQVTDTPAPKH